MKYVIHSHEASNNENLMNKTILSLALILFSLTVNALEIIAPAIAGLIEKDKKGAYQLLLKEAANRASINYKEDFYPQKRALRTFFEKKSHCIYAYTDIAVTKLGKDKIKASFPLGGFKQHIFTKTGTPALTSINQLKGKVVGGILGDGEQDWFAAFKKAGIEYQFVTRIEQNIVKLERGRIDAMISFMPDVAKWEDQLNYARDKPLFSAFDMITCHNNLEGSQFIKRISPVLKRMKKDGTMKAILGDLYLEYNENEIPKY